MGLVWRFGDGISRMGLLVGVVISASGMLSSCGRVGYGLLPNEQVPPGTPDASTASLDAQVAPDGSPRDSAVAPDARIGADGGGLDGGSVDAGGAGTGGLDSGVGPADAGLADSGPGGLAGLIAWYRFDDDPNDGAFDSSGNGRDGVCVAGECPQLISGRVGGAYDFDGVDDHVTAADGDRYFDGAAGFSVAFWAFARGTGVQTPVVKPFDRFAISWGVELHPPNRDFFLTTVPGVDPPPGSFTTGQWFHYVGTWDGSEGQFYRNGSVVGSFDGPITFDTNPLVIGGYRTLTTDFANALEGMVDEVMVFDRALSPTEVSDLANP